MILINFNKEDIGGDIEDRDTAELSIHTVQLFIAQLRLSIYYCVIFIAYLNRNKTVRTQLSFVSDYPYYHLWYISGFQIRAVILCGRQLIQIRV